MSTMRRLLCTLSLALLRMTRRPTLPVIFSLRSESKVSAEWRHSVARERRRNTRALETRCTQAWVRLQSSTNGISGKLRSAAAAPNESLVCHHRRRVDKLLHSCARSLARFLCVTVNPTDRCLCCLCLCLCRCARICRSITEPSHLTLASSFSFTLLPFPPPFLSSSMSHECRCGEVDASGIGGSRNSAYPMIEVSEATRLVLAEVAKLTDTATQKHQYLPLAQAVGHVAAQNRHATQPFPAFPASTMVSDTARQTTRPCSTTTVILISCVLALFAVHRTDTRSLPQTVLARSRWCRP